MTIFPLRIAFGQSCYFIQFSLFWQSMLKIEPCSMQKRLSIQLIDFAWKMNLRARSRGRTALLLDNPPAHCARGKPLGIKY